MLGQFCRSIGLLCYIFPAVKTRAEEVTEPPKVTATENETRVALQV